MTDENIKSGTVRYPAGLISRAQIKAEYEQIEKEAQAILLRSVRTKKGAIK